LLLSATLAFFFSLLAMLFLTHMRRPWKRAQRYIKRGGVTQSQVVDHGSAGPNEDGAPMYTTIVEFSDATGRRFRTQEMGAASSPKPIGTVLEVAYDVNDPRNAVVIGAARDSARLALPVGFMFVAFAGISFIYFVVALLVGGLLAGSSADRPGSLELRRRGVRVPARAQLTVSASRWP
jgi:hypothetical protein